MKTFPEIVNKTVRELLEHKETLKIMEDSIISLLENPETKKIIEEALVRAIIAYGKKTML